MRHRSTIFLSHKLKTKNIKNLITCVFKYEIEKQNVCLLA